MRPGGASRARRRARSDVDGGRSVNAVRQAVLDVLAALPDRPDRLRVSTDAVTIELDWRSRGEESVPKPTPAAKLRADNVTEVPVSQVHEDPGCERALLEQAAPDLRHICAPSVGTFYRAPEPGAPPFVAVGSTVTAGQQIGIVEVMKLMLPIEADQAGRIVDVLVEDCQAVEHGQPLMALSVTGSE